MNFFILFVCVASITLTRGELKRNFTHWIGQEDVYHELIRVPSSQEFFERGEYCRDNGTWYDPCPTSPVLGVPDNNVCSNETADNLAFKCPLSCNKCGSDAFLTVPRKVQKLPGQVCIKLSRRSPWSCIEHEKNEIELKSYIDFHIHKEEVATDVGYCPSAVQDFELSFLFRRRGNLQNGLTLAKETTIKACMILKLADDNDLQVRNECFDNTGLTHEIDFSSEAVNEAWRKVTVTYNNVDCVTNTADDISVYLEIDKGSEHFDIDELVFTIPDDGALTNELNAPQFSGLDYIPKSLINGNSRWDCRK